MGVGVEVGEGVGAGVGVGTHPHEVVTMNVKGRVVSRFVNMTHIRFGHSSYTSMYRPCDKCKIKMLEMVTSGLKMIGTFAEIMD